MPLTPSDASPTPNWTPSGTRPVALVTGGAKRVGRAIALALARQGCDVAITYSTSQREARETAREIEALGVSAGVFPLTFDASDINDAVRALALQIERCDVLVHNASVYESAPLDSLTLDRLTRDYTVNAAAPALLSAAFAPALQRSTLPGGGAIVAMADMHVLGRPRRELLSYSMSKAALLELVRTLARKLAPRVRVNGVAPGVVGFPEHGPESRVEFQATYLSRVPLERAGTPEDAAEVARWLALDAHYVTGEIVRVDGGRWLA